ncbi:MAG: protein-methionine-sulfoxide reductase catalytic subunit MsrP [Proteobacteria bacterium]|nr:protein-methionine-sulfoxide reductase catalytic subunit MsrP [Pseudomonadota bacterium]
MLTKRKRGWEMPESRATPEDAFRRRRELIKGLAAGPILAASGAALLAGAGEAAAAKADADPSAGLYPAGRNERFKLDRPLTDEKMVTTYNNFYEFGSSKNIWRAARDLPIRPWQVRLTGMVEKEQTVDIDTLLKRMPLEERLYRHRCVEAWSMAVPWSGFPMKALVEFARPLASAKYVRMETFMNPAVAGRQRQPWFPWPYVEGLTIEEATNELAFIGTGLYGKPMPKANGAPIRLVTPWKYGFKSVKSLVLFEFTDKKPVSFWETLQGSEYGFWANVNPNVAHPRWSQASERVLGAGDTVPTLIYNGYGEFVAHLYPSDPKERTYFY